MSRENYSASIGIALAAYEPDLEYFQVQLASLQTQTHSDFICIIPFDSDMDPILADGRIAPFRIDARFRFVANTSRLGHKKNFEKAIALCVEAGVEAIACCDQDDVWYPQKLALSLEYWRKMPPFALVHSDMHVLEGGITLPQTVWQYGGRGARNTSTRDLLVRNVVAGCAMLFDARLARRYPVIDARCGFHDHWYALMASRLGGVHMIPEPLSAYRQTGANTVGVEPHRSLFWFCRRLSPTDLLAKCRKGWVRSKELASALDGLEPGLSRADRALFLDGGRGAWDFLPFAMSHFGEDGTLARACLARAMGKTFPG